MGPRHPELPHDADEDEWPIGMRPDGTLRLVDPETGELLEPDPEWDIDADFPHCGNTTTHTRRSDMAVRYTRDGTIPKTVPPGRVLMHNHVIHGIRWGCGINGFRSWTANKPFPGFVLCPCGWAGLKHYARKEHVKDYRENPERWKRRVRAAEREWGQENI